MQLSSPGLVKVRLKVRKVRIKSKLLNLRWSETNTEQFRYPLSVSLNCESRKVLLTCSCHVHKWRNTYKYGSQTNGTRHWHDWCIDWGLKTAGVSSYIEPRDDGAAQTNRQWQYASNIDEYNCQEDNCLSVELFNNVFSKSISVIVDILFHFYLYSAAV